VFAHVPLAFGWPAVIGAPGVLLVCVFAHEHASLPGYKQWLLAAAATTSVVGAALGLVISLASLRSLRRLVWGPVRVARVWAELGAISLLCNWLGWELVMLTIMR